MALKDLLDAEIFSFNGRDFANWLKAGIPVYYGAKEPMEGQRVPDAFPFARGFIGRNEAGLPDDLKNLYDQLDPVTKVEMERGVSLLWAETEFKDDADFAIARTLLTLACRIPVKALIDVLPDSLTLFAIADEEASSDAAKRQVRQIRRLAFQAAIELVSASGRSIRCLEQFMEDTSLGESLLVKGQALKVLSYLGIKYPDRFLHWAAIFGQAVVADHKADSGSAFELREVLMENFGEQRIEHAIELVREHGVHRIQTEDGALSLKSMRGLYDLVPVLFAGREGSAYDEKIVIVPWPPAAKAGAATGEIIRFERSLSELRGR